MRLTSGAIEGEERRRKLPEGGHLQVEDLDGVDARAVVAVQVATRRRERLPEPLDAAPARLGLEALRGRRRDELRLRIRPPTKSAHSSHFTGESPVTMRGDGQNEKGEPARGEIAERSAPRFPQEEGLLPGGARWESLHLGLVQVADERPGKPLEEVFRPPHRFSASEARGRYKRRRR